MPEVRIAAEPRTEFGKGAARRTRREGRVPAVLYGHGAETRHVVLPGHDLMLALKTPNVLIRIEGVPGVTGLALPKAVQRDPIKGFIEHADLILVRRGEKVTVDIAVRVSGDIAPDGLLDQQVVQLSVEAEATNIPDGIDVDVTGMRGRQFDSRGRPHPAARYDPPGRPGNADRARSARAHRGADGGGDRRSRGGRGPDP